MSIYDDLLLNPLKVSRSAAFDPVGQLFRRSARGLGSKTPLGHVELGNERVRSDRESRAQIEGDILKASSTRPGFEVFDYCPLAFPVGFTNMDPFNKFFIRL